MIAALADVAPVPTKRLALQLSPDAFRQLRGGHPWVYADAIKSVKGQDRTSGTLAVVFDRDRAFAGIGLWDPDSPIRLRVLHAGKPVQIDAAYWASKVQDAQAIRRELASTGTTAYRLLNGENDGFGGLVIDRYEHVLVAKVYTAAWLPHLEVILNAAIASTGATTIVLRLGRLLAGLPAADRANLVDGQVLLGEPPSGPISFLENGLRFSADVVKGQKTGHFLDQRENRQRVRDLTEQIRASGRAPRVLDVFSCTGGFSVHAAAGGAREVHSVDQSPHAIEAAQQHMADNSPEVEHLTTVGDAFEVLDQLCQKRERYDIVVVDPPSFASSARERDAAMRAYRKLAELAVPLVRPGGWLVQASCSSRISEDDLVATMHASIRSHGRTITGVDITGHAIDHPVTFPQGRYLKAFFAELAG